MARGEGGGAVWDLPIRVFHWSLLVLVGVAWWSQETGDLNLHRLVGSAVVGLLVFRIWWGIFGSSTARFTAFVKGPRAVLAYARALLDKAQTRQLVGHNPLGGWSVMALIGCLLVIVGCGLFAVDVDGLESGALSSMVSFETGRLASKIHGIGFQTLEALVVLHLLAIAAYGLLKRQNLVGPMVTGRQGGLHESQAMVPGSPTALVIGVGLGVGVGAWLMRLNGAF